MEDTFIKVGCPLLTGSPDLRSYHLPPCSLYPHHAGLQSNSHLRPFAVTVSLLHCSSLHPYKAESALSSKSLFRCLLLWPSYLTLCPPLHSLFLLPLSSSPHLPIPQSLLVVCSLPSLRSVSHPALYNPQVQRPCLIFFPAAFQVPCVVFGPMVCTPFVLITQMNGNLRVAVVGPGLMAFRWLRIHGSCGGLATNVLCLT